MTSGLRYRGGGMGGGPFGDDARSYYDPDCADWRGEGAAGSEPGARGGDRRLRPDPLQRVLMVELGAPLLARLRGGAVRGPASASPALDSAQPRLRLP